MHDVYKLHVSVLSLHRNSSPIYSSFYLLVCRSPGTGFLALEPRSKPDFQTAAMTVNSVISDYKSLLGTENNLTGTDKRNCDARQNLGSKTQNISTLPYRRSALRRQTAGANPRRSL
jgi:hypothetical protein